MLAYPFSENKGPHRRGISSVSSQRPAHLSGPASKTPPESEYVIRKKSESKWWGPRAIYRIKESAAPIRWGLPLTPIPGVDCDSPARYRKLPTPKMAKTPNAKVLTPGVPQKTQPLASNPHKPGDIYPHVSFWAKCWYTLPTWIVWKWKICAKGKKGSDKKH